jgi:hypothetical protein
VSRGLLFDLIYPIVLRREGNPVWPIRRHVRPVGEAKRKAFDDLLQDAVGDGGIIPYDLPYPKSEFLNYACDWYGLVAHGSQLDALATLQPVRLSSDSTEFGNRQQIFCSPDATWAMWFAILDKQRVRVTRNGCVRIGEGARRVKYYHFGLAKQLRGGAGFSPGVIYFARPEDFPSRHQIAELHFFGGEYEEWGSEVPVKILAGMPVRPEDFPYLDKVRYYL